MSVADGDGKTGNQKHVPQVTKCTLLWFLVPHGIYIIGVAGLESLSSGQKRGDALHKVFTFLS